MHLGLIHKCVFHLIFSECCYEENIFLARGKPQQMKMTVEINSNLKYAIYTNILTRQYKRPTSSRRSMKSIVEHLTQSNIPANCPQQPSNTSIW
jgi:hypothetical protein